MSKKRKKAGRRRSVRRRGTRFLILCEGQTERLYFQSFRNLGVEILPRDPGGDAEQLLQDAIKLSGEDDYDQIWLVFDLDYVPKQGARQFEKFSRVLDVAERNGIRTAYSVDAFELWFYLHYAYTEQRHDRKFYFDQLGKRWAMNYERDGKKKKFAATIRQLLTDDPDADEQRAIRRAKKLFDKFRNEPVSDRNPITTVYQLVEEILKSQEAQ